MREYNEKPYKVILKSFAYISQIGFRVVACILIGVLLGKYLDGVLGTSPGLLLFFALIGTAAAFKLILEGLK